MKFTLYCRAAKHPRFRDGKRIAASSTQNFNPLTVGVPTSYQGEREVHTAFFKLVIDVPNELLAAGDIPAATIALDPGATATVTPDVEQLAVDPATPVVEQEVAR